MAEIKIWGFREQQHMFMLLRINLGTSGKDMECIFRSQVYPIN